MSRIDFVSGEVSKPGTEFFICSNGLSNMVEEINILKESENYSDVTTQTNKTRSILK